MNLKILRSVSRQGKLLLRLTALLSLAAVAITLCAIRFAPFFLARYESPADKPLDCLVVLGGDIGPRVVRAAELYHAAPIPFVLVSGDGDGEHVAALLTSSGVPRDRIKLEGASTTTYENAKFSVPLLRKAECRRIGIVTTWFHSRRALACFRKAAPDLEFVSLPTVADRPVGWPNRYYREWVLKEYAKLAGYWVRYGVSPF